MKISINWIKDFVNLDGIETEELIKRFNLSTAEIEGVEYRGSNVSGVVFGKVLSIQDIEGSKNHLLSVDVGDEKLQIVCGAPNVRVGMTTCVAKVGANVQGFKITEAQRNGITSYGMCCGYTELGIGSDDSGIIDLDGDYTLGQDVKEVFPIDDVVFEIDNKSLTNRPDLWGHYGIAREFACIFDRKLKSLPTIDMKAFDGLKSVQIKNESKNCYRYSALTVDNITVKKSPIPMAIRLCYCGMRDINLLADLTNYMLLELGQPMHAFDNEKVSSIIVRDALENEKLLTLEGEEHDIPEGACLISNENREPVAIAGVKGGLLSGITDETNSVLFESATFDPVSIRKTSRAIGLITDASQRYEKSLDPEMTKLALERILYVLRDIDNGIVVSSCFSDEYTKKYETISITVTADFISKRVGTEISKDFIVSTLTKLGFKVDVKGEEINITVPSYRATKDVSMREDIVEEVARIYGYDNIEPKPLELECVPAPQIKEHECEYQTKYLLAEKYNLNEVHSYIWNYEAFNREHKIESNSYLSLNDASNAGQSGIRSELMPTLLKFYEENKNSSAEVGIFEIGRVVTGLDENNLAIEKKKLSIVLASPLKTEKELFFELKAMIVDVAKNVVGFDVDAIAPKSYPSYMHPRAVASVASREGEYGYFGVIHPTTAKLIDKKWKVVGLEIDFSQFANARSYAQKAKQVSKYQNVLIDFTFNVPKSMLYADFMKLLSKARAKILRGFELVSIYEDASTPDTKAISVQAELASFDHTLTAAEIEAFRNDVIATMLKNKIALKA